MIMPFLKGFKAFGKFRHLRHQANQHAENRGLPGVQCWEESAGRSALPHLIHQGIKRYAIVRCQSTPVGHQSLQFVLNPYTPRRYASTHTPSSARRKACLFKTRLLKVKVLQLLGFDDEFAGTSGKNGVHVGGNVHTNTCLSLNR
tara:strand:- start:1 stop:435 length:435 start_codon:yes stop_codon:yes gene_type:complete